MPYTGWFCYDGTDVVDNCRTLAYLRNVSADGGCSCSNLTECGCCPSLHADDVYVDPFTDPAPWYDPAVPESENFYGLLTTRITGLGPGEITREITPRASGAGGLLSRKTQGAPVITVTAHLLAADTCAADFGLRWLTATLVGVCQEDRGCSGADLVFYTCCPAECEDTPGGGGGENSCDRFRRTLYNVAMTSGPEVLDWDALGDDQCGVAYEIEFQLGAANPCQYGQVIELSGSAFIADTSDDCRFEWVSESECAEAGCQDLDPCLIDPGCAPSILPPQPASPTVCGACDPWEIANACINTIPDLFPSHADGVPIITLSSGSAPLRATTVRFFPNPGGVPSDELLADDCLACSEITITRIPPNSTLVIDGAREKITISCEGGEPVDASRLVAAGSGTLPFSWPVLACSNLVWTICATTDGEVVANDASMDVSIAVRECA